MTCKVKTLAVGAALLILAGCSAPDKPAGVPAAAPDAQYLIGPGDSLEVSVWGNPDLTASVPVRPDGKISTPLVEDMQAVGKTPTQLARDMEASLANFVKNPQVSVVVRSFLGTYAEQIRVVGKAVKPTALSYRRGMTVLDVMIEVGGLAEGAAGNRAKVVRVIDGKQTQIPVRLNDMLNDGDLAGNIEMQPGDVLIIPESRL